MKSGFSRAVFLVLVLRMVSAPVAYRPSGAFDHIAARYVLRVCQWHPGSSAQKLIRRLPSSANDFDQRWVEGELAAGVVDSKQEYRFGRKCLNDEWFKQAFVGPLRC